MDGVEATGPARNPKTLWIVLGVVAALLLCCAITLVALLAGGIIAYNSVEETRVSEVETQLEAIDEAIEDLDSQEFLTEDDVLQNESDEDIWYEAERAVEHFHPSFHLAMMGLAETYDDVERYNLVAESDQTPGFLIAFMAPRELPEGDPIEGEYLDDRSGMLWRHEGWGDNGMAAFAGPNALVNDVMRAGIEQVFVDAHGDWVVTDFDLHSNIKIGLGGIHSEDLGFWYGDYTTFSAIYDSDLQAGVWRETSFDDQR